MPATLNPRRPTPGAPRPYHFPDFTRTTLANGLTVWAVPVPSAAVVNIHLLVDAGASSEDEPHGGLAALTAQLLVTGTQRLDASAFAEATERLGIEVSSESSWDSARAAFQALPEHTDEGLALLAEMVRQPRFDPGEFDRLKAERLADILQARADPGRLADEMFIRHLFDAATPYRRLSAGTPETVTGLTLDDVRSFHATHWAPGTANLIVAGPLDADTVLRVAERHLADWSGTGPGHRVFEPRAAGERRVVLVDRPGSVQTEIRVGQLGINRRSERYFPAMVLGALLGGVFGSRLNLRLREELGYTYGARAGFDARRAVGPFSAAAAVQTDVTADAMREMVELLTRVRDTAPPESELHEVRDYLVGVFPLRFETTGGVAMAIEPLAIHGLPDDYWHTYRQRLEAVGADDVLAAARDLLHPDQFLILGVGDANQVQAAVEATGLGPLQAAPSD
jgi:zinc protease